LSVNWAFWKGPANGQFLLTNREIIASLSIRPEVSLTSSQ
jgi:hypothetical protein